MLRYLFLILLITPLCADPWGKDADMACCRHACVPCKRQHGPLISFAECMIRFHKHVISPADGPRSHYTPSSSIYTLQSIRKYGFFWGFLFGCDRLMRENNDEWLYPKVCGEYNCTVKWNPVP